MYLSIVEAVGTGSAINVAVPPYIAKEHITVTIDGAPTEAFSWVNSQTISVVAPLNRKVRVIRRTSPQARLTDYIDGKTLGADTLDIDSKQAFFMAQEAWDAAQDATGLLVGRPTVGGVELTTQGILDLLAGRITPSQLELELRSTIGLVTGDETAVNSMAWRVKQEALARIQAVQAEADARIAALQQESNNRVAAVLQEKTERLAGDNALGQRIDLVVASVDRTTAAVQTETTARVEADNALAAQVTNLQASMQSADTALSARIDAEQAARVNADNAAATDITILKAQVGGGDNLFPNPTFTRGTGTYGFSDSRIFERTDTGVPAGAPSQRVYGNDAGWVDAGKPFPVRPGEVFEVETWVGLAAPLAGSPNVGILIATYDSAQAQNGTVWGAARAADFTGWQKVNGSFTVPANAPFISIMMYVSRAQTAGQPSAYFSVPVVRRKAASLAAVETSSAATATRLSGVEANYTIKVQARSDGRQAIAGIGLNATASGSAAQSEMVFLADKFTFVPSMADLNTTPQPLLVAGVVNGANTLVVPGQRLGDKMVEARMIVDGGIETRHMKITGGYGMSLWPDRNFEDPKAWAVVGWGVLPSAVSITDGAAGGVCMRCPTGGTSSAQGVRLIPVTVGRRYRISCRARRSANANGTLYLRLKADTDPFAPYTQPGNFVLGVEGVTPTTSWALYSFEWVATAPFAAPMVLLNYTATAGYMEAQDIRIEEMLDSSLVVQGGISADRIDTRGLSIKDAAGNVILAAGTPLAASALPPEANSANVANSGCINRDPSIVIPSVWTRPSTITINGPSDTFGATAGFYLTCSSGVDQVAWDAGPPRPGGYLNYPLDPGRTYNLNANFYQGPGNDRHMYLVVDMFDASGNRVATTWGGTYSGYTYGGLLPAQGRWYRVGNEFGANTARPIPGNVTSCRIGVWFQYSGGGGSQVQQAAQDVRLVDVTTGKTADWPSVVSRPRLIEAVSAGYLNTTAPRSPGVYVDGAGLQGPFWWGFTWLNANTLAVAEHYTVGPGGGSPDTAADKLEWYLNNAPGVILVVTTSDHPTGMYNARMLEALYRYGASRAGLGSDAFLGTFRAAYTLIGSPNRAPGSGVEAYTRTSSAHCTATAWVKDGQLLGNQKDLQITQGNASTFIANAAIGAAQVGVLTAQNLSVQAISGTVNGGASSGGRVDITTNKVAVYDSTGALRVVMGYLL